MAIDSVQTLCKYLSNFSEDISDFINLYDENHSTSSIINDYLSTYGDTDAVFTALSQATLLIEACGDYFSCFIKTITEPILPISMYSAIRSIIESSSLAIWLLDPEIELKERIYRSLRLRMNGLEQQKKCAPNLSKIDLEKIQGQIQRVKQKALNLGFLKNQNGILRVDNLNMPTFVELSKLSMGTDFVYRILSIMVHNNPSAVSQTSFKRVEIDKKGQKVEPPKNVFFVEKTFNLESAITLSQLAIVYLAKPIWMKCCLYGWDDKQLLEVILKYYKLLEIGEGNAFWKKQKLH